MMMRPLAATHCSRDGRARRSSGMVRAGGSQEGRRGPTQAICPRFRRSAARATSTKRSAEPCLSPRALRHALPAWLAISSRAVSGVKWAIDKVSVCFTAPRSSTPLIDALRRFRGACLHVGSVGTTTDGKALDLSSARRRFRFAQTEPAMPKVWHAIA